MEDNAPFLTVPLNEVYSLIELAKTSSCRVVIILNHVKESYGNFQNETAQNNVV